MFFLCIVSSIQHNDIKSQEHLRLLHIAAHGTVHLGFSNRYSRTGQPTTLRQRNVKIPL